MNKIKQIVKSKFRTGLKTIPYIFIAVLIGITAVYASSTTSLTPSGSASNTMYSLTDIWNLASGTIVDENTGTIETTPSEVSLSGKSLSDVYTALSTEINKLADAKIAKNTTSFGFTGTLYGDTDPTQVLTTADYPGTAVAPPTFASAYVNQYNCSWFTTMTDSTQPGVTSAQICASNTGCSWVSGACSGGIQTGKAYISWYAGKAACANSTEGGQIAGTWYLPTYGQLVDHYVNNNIGGNPPTGFASVDYWSGSTYPSSTGLAYYVSMLDGRAYGDYKDYEDNFLAHCAR